MNEFKHLKKLISLERKIRKKNTGTPDELAKHLKVSRSGLYWLIEKLKSFDAGVEIGYCPFTKTHYYSGNKAIKLTFNIEVESLTEMTDEEMEDVSGGTKLFSFFFESPIFVDCKVISL